MSKNKNKNKKTEYRLAVPSIDDRMDSTPVPTTVTVDRNTEGLGSK